MNRLTIQSSFITALLDKECFFPCSAYTDLKKAIKAYQKENPA